MTIIPIILGVLLAVAAAIIFCLWQVLKNIYLKIYLTENMIERKPQVRAIKAYNGVYYPANIIAKLEFGSPQEMKLIDFSMYEKYKIIGFTIYTKETLEEYYGDIISELNEINDDIIEELVKPVLLKNKLVFEVSEGNWTWKSAD